MGVVVKMFRPGEFGLPDGPGCTRGQGKDQEGVELAIEENEINRSADGVGAISSDACDGFKELGPQVFRRLL